MAKRVALRVWHDLRIFDDVFRRDGDVRSCVHQIPKPQSASPHRHPCNNHDGAAPDQSAGFWRTRVYVFGLDICHPFNGYGRGSGHRDWKARFAKAVGSSVQTSVGHGSDRLVFTPDLAGFHRPIGRLSKIDEGS